MSAQQPQATSQTPPKPEVTYNYSAQAPGQSEGFFSRHKTGIIIGLGIVGVVVACQLLGKKCKKENPPSAACSVINGINGFVDTITAPFVWAFQHFWLLVCLAALSIFGNGIARLFSRLSDPVRDYVESTIAENDGAVPVQQEGDEVLYLADKDGNIKTGPDGKPMRATPDKVSQVDKIRQADMAPELKALVPAPNSEYAPMGSKADDDVEPEAEAQGVIYGEGGAVGGTVSFGGE